MTVGNAKVIQPSKRVWLVVARSLLVMPTLVICVTATASVTCQDGSCDFHLSTRNGTECLTAKLSAVSVQVPYPCENFTAVCRASVAMTTANAGGGSNDTTASGQCGNGTASLKIAWLGGSFQLRLQLLQQNFYSSQIMSSFDTYNFVGHLSLQVDLRDSAFANASIDEAASPIVTFANERKIFLFASPVGMTFLCRSPESATLHQLAPAVGKLPKARVTFVGVQMDAFRSSAPTDGLLEGPFPCEADANTQAKSATVLVISGVLSVCLLVTVAGCLATRLNKNSGYTSMD